jgi:hypothetical protein
MLSMLPSAAAYMSLELPRTSRTLGPGSRIQLAEGSEIVVSDGQIERAIFSGWAQNGESQGKSCDVWFRMDPLVR